MTEHGNVKPPPKLEDLEMTTPPTVANRSTRICSLILSWHYTGTIGYKGNLAGGLNLTHLASLNQRTREVGDDEFCFRMTSSVVLVMFVSGSLGWVWRGWPFNPFTFHVIQHLLVFICILFNSNLTYIMYILIRFVYIRFVLLYIIPVGAFLV